MCPNRPRGGGVWHAIDCQHHLGLPLLFFIKLIFAIELLVPWHLLA